MMGLGWLWKSMFKEEKALGNIVPDYTVDRSQQEREHNNSKPYQPRHLTLVSDEIEDSSEMKTNLLGAGALVDAPFMKVPE